MKKITLTIIFIILNACVYINETNNYRVRGTQYGYEIKSYPNYDKIFSEKTGIFLSVFFEESDNEIFIRMNSIKNTKLELIDKIKIVDDKDVNIKVNDIKIEQEKIDDIEKTYISIKLGEKLEKMISLNLGKIKIGNEIFQGPVIFMQRYKIKESASLLGDLLYEAGYRNGPLYKKTEWIE